MNTAKKVAFVGPGRLATALALALSEPFRVLGAVGGGPLARQRFEALTGRRAGLAPLALLPDADVVFLTVPDRLIAEVAAEGATAGWFRKGQVVAHTSGACDTSVLAAAEATGIHPLAFHPLQTIADPALGPSLFRGVVFSYQGDPVAERLAVEIIERLGAIPWRLPPAARPRLHAVAVLSSNALQALLAVLAEAVAGDAPPGEDGRSFALKALGPLAETAVANVRRLGLPTALTGPVERGDLPTVERNLAALDGLARQLYELLLPVLVRLAREKGSLSTEAAQAFEGLLRRGDAGCRNA